MELRINKYIAEAGVCSRRNADELIENRRVKVNGKAITELGMKITDKDVVEVDGKVICIQTEKIYIMLNKPRGYVTTAKEQFGRPSILDLINSSTRVFPVGRLDMDSEGLILLTNDGDFANQIIHPTKHVAKKYEVTLARQICNKDVEALSEGVDIGGYITKPAIVEKINDSKIIITIKEGKNRQIRKMCEAVGNKVNTLKRVAIGKLTLGNLNPGESRMLRQEDIKKIFQ